MSNLDEVRCVLVGFGNIGKALKAKIDKIPEWKIEAIIRNGSVCDGEGGPIQKIESGLPELDVHIAFLAIPSGSPEIELKYMRHFFERDIRVATCTKGALSHRYDALIRHLSEIGFNASVGGGTGLLDSLRSRVYKRNDVIVHAVLNGSMNFIMSEMDTGSSLGVAIDRAKALGYLDPGSHEPLGIFETEIKDTAMKATIVFNSCMRKIRCMRASQISFRKFGSEELDEITHKVHLYRYIVSFIPQPHDRAREEHFDYDEIVGGFTCQVDGGYTIVAGFRRIDSDPVFLGRLPSGADNCVITVEGANGEDGIYVLNMGLGAGPKPTAATMIRDAHVLLQRES